MRVLSVYTDGGFDYCSGCGAHAYIIVNSEGKTINFESFGLLNQTSNRHEYLAVIEALNHLKKHERNMGDLKIVVYSDSMLLVNTWNKWIDGWKAKNWPSRLKNIDLVKTLYSLKVEFGESVELKWIKGHSGHRFNELVDRMCSNEIKKLSLRRH